MSIDKVVRTISEKTTSVQNDVEVTQKGIITFVPVSGRVIGIPTTIEDPRFLSLMPMSAITSQALGASLAQSWYCDLALYKASDVSKCFGSIASSVLNSEVGQRVRINSASLDLYSALASMAAGYASDTRLASTAYWKRDTRFADNAQKFLKVTIANSASVSFKTKKQTLAYVVTGYNYS